MQDLVGGKIIFWVIIVVIICAALGIFAYWPSGQAAAAPAQPIEKKEQHPKKSETRVGVVRMKAV
jgi:flagellar basal body-associated protein FliL